MAFAGSAAVNPKDFSVFVEFDPVLDEIDLFIALVLTTRTTTREIVVEAAEVTP